MNVIVKIIVALVIGLLGYQSQAQENYTITITVNEANSNDGKMFVALYNKEGNFLNKTYKASKSEIKNKQSIVTFEDVPAGTYAVSVFHDENDNGKIDTNFVGIPKEDYGCSNDAKGFMGPPKWKDAKFTLSEDKSVIITL